MKKILCALLCLCMVFSLCACAGQDVSGQQTAAPDDAGGAAPADKDGDPSDGAVSTVSHGAELGDRVIIYTKKTQETYDGPDGSIILVFSYVTPRVRIDERAEVADKINEQLNLLEEAYISGTGDEGGRNHLLESATDNFVYIYETGADLNKVFTSARTVRSMRADGSVVSFRFWTSVYTGGASGKHSYFGISYDTQTGEKLTLDSLSPEPEAFKKALAENLVALVREDIILSDEMSASGIDMESALAAIVREGNWYFDTDGIVIFPDFGELRPEDEGFPMFTVPYSALADLMYDRYLPAKREGVGSLEIVRVKDVQDGTVASIDRLVVSDGEEMYLKIDGTVYDLRISSFYYVDQVEGDERFYETDLHWYASFMTDCALQICAVVPNGMPDLMISYTDQDNVMHRRFLSESGENGGITLVDDTIKAVG